MSSFGDWSCVIGSFYVFYLCLGAVTFGASSCECLLFGVLACVVLWLGVLAFGVLLFGVIVSLVVWSFVVRRYGAYMCLDTGRSTSRKSESFCQHTTW